jgi:hypothetical protein
VEGLGTYRKKVRFFVGLGITRGGLRPIGGTIDYSGGFMAYRGKFVYFVGA